MDRKQKEKSDLRMDEAMRHVEAMKVAERV